MKITDKIHVSEVKDTDTVILERNEYFKIDGDKVYLIYWYGKESPFAQLRLEQIIEKHSGSKAVEEILQELESVM